MTNTLPIALKDPYLVHEMPLSWESVFDFWRRNEARLPHWTAYWTAKGYGSWEQWRMEKVRHFGLASLNWQYYRVEMPYISIPAFRGGPFKGWQERFYKGLTMPTFEELANDRDGIRNSPDIAKYLVDFPAKTILTGVVVERQVVVMEGMHRCAALSLVAEKGRTLNIEHDIHLCLAKWPDDRPLVTAP